MTAYDFLHIALHAMGDQIKGKTKLQKTVYFMATMGDCSEDLGYRAHYYGPYSSDVAEAADRLRALGFVEQSVATGGAVNSHGFEVARYDYLLNAEGVRVAEAKAKRYPELWKKLQAAAKGLREAGDLDYVELSVAAKTYFMLAEKRGKATIEGLAKLANKFGWSVDHNQLTEAATFLEKVGLVTLEGA